VFILEVTEVPGSHSASGGGNATEYARVRSTSDPRREAWVRRSHLSPDADAHSERSTLLSPSLSGRSAGEGREGEALDTSTSSLNPSEFDDAVGAGYRDNTEVERPKVQKWGRWIPTEIREAREARLKQAATAATAATSIDMHGDNDDADNRDEDAEAADN
jgi:hypothetical protein